MELEAGVREALDEVRSDGLKDKVEHVLIIRDGQCIARADGDEHHVSLENHLHLIQPGDIVVHNHPGELNSLSNVDLTLAHRLHAKAIYAITDDGSIYKASVLTDQPIKLMMLYELEILMFVDKAVAAAADAVPTFRDRLNESHWVNMRLGEKGFIRYDYELGKDTAELIAQFDTKLAEYKLLNATLT